MAKPKILLVDDTRLVLELEKSFLKLSDVEVLTAGNGVEALALMRQEPPHLVFMDMNMPEMDGITCCSIVKSDPFLNEIPVVMLTTAGNDEDRERAVKAGCNDFITKPIDRKEFLEIARRYTESVDRRGARIPCQLPVLFVHAKSPASGHALDISDGGLFLATHELLKNDAPLKLALYLPTSTPQLLEVSGRVAWVNEEGKRVCTTLPAGVGVQFLDLEEKKSALLQSFLETEQKKGA